MTMNDERLAALLRGTYGERVVAFRPELARVLGGINEALIFQQISYHCRLSPDGWTFVTADQLEHETSVKPDAQTRARVNLGKLGIIEQDKRTRGNRLRFRVRWERLLTILESQNQESRIAKAGIQNPGNAILETGKRDSPIYENRDEIKERKEESTARPNPNPKPRAVPKPTEPAAYISDDWQPSEADRTYAIETGIPADKVTYVTEGFVLYWAEQRDRKVKDAKRIWSKTWQMWVRRTVERGDLEPRRASQPGRRQPGTRPVPDPTQEGTRRDW